MVLISPNSSKIISSLAIIFYQSISYKCKQQKTAVLSTAVQTVNNHRFNRWLFTSFPSDSQNTTPRFLVIVVLTRPWGLLVASALGGATLTLPLWAMVLLGIIGVAVFLLGMKYGDRWEESILKKFRHTKEDSSRP